MSIITGISKPHNFLERSSSGRAASVPAIRCNAGTIQSLRVSGAAVCSFLTAPCTGTLSRLYSTCISAAIRAILQLNLSRLQSNHNPQIKNHKSRNAHSAWCVMNNKSTNHDPWSWTKHHASWIMHRESLNVFFANFLQPSYNQQFMPCLQRSKAGNLRYINRMS